MGGREIFKQKGQPGRKVTAARDDDGALSTAAVICFDSHLNALLLISPFQRLVSSPPQTFYHGLMVVILSAVAYSNSLAGRARRHPSRRQLQHKKNTS